MRSSRPAGAGTSAARAEPPPSGGSVMAAVDRLGVLSGAASVFGHPEGTLTSALEKVTGGSFRAVVVYAPDSGGRLLPVGSAAPSTAGAAGVGRVLSTQLSEVASGGRLRIVAARGEHSDVGAALGDPDVEQFLLVPFWAGPDGWGVVALAFAAPGIDLGWQAFATVLGALIGQRVATDQLKGRVATLEGLLHAQATVDPLTGLPNQVEFVSRLNGAMAEAERDGRMVGVAFMDLDRFRTVNDVLGHVSGDKLLQQVAERLADRFGHHNVFRMAGDEFVLLRERLGRDEDHPRSFDAARRALRRPFVCDGQDLTVTASIGIALYPYDGEDVGTLVKNADCAMFRAKERGGDIVECYSHGLFEEARRRLSLERSLRRAVETDEIILDFQPQFDLRTGAVAGFEALARWHHPDLGVLLPGAFIALAEETGLIVPIGERVMEIACHQARQWASTHPGLRVWVNLSARQFHQGDLPDLVGRCLELAGLPADLLGVEVTESLAMRHPAEAAAVLGELARLGVKTAFDDFGTGYSSLAYLSRFSVDVLKLDREFVQHGPRGGTDAAIARAVIALARSLGITVVAEGVETESQRLFLVHEGCDQAQGFLLARPMGPAAVSRFLAHTDRVRSR